MEISCCFSRIANYTGTQNDYALRHSVREPKIMHPCNGAPKKILPGVVPIGNKTDLPTAKI
jgi:hypothetical protein